VQMSHGPQARLYVRRSAHVALLAAGGGSPPPPGDEPLTVGTTFSPERSVASGLDDLEAFKRLEAMGSPSSGSPSPGTRWT
jgi:hypothetical protein